MIFPSEVSLSSKCNNKINLYFITDWHPNVLGLTNVGCNDDGAVMYIGPDSLALIQHFTTSILPHHIQQMNNNINNNSTSITTTSASSYHILDLCCGSGIQSIANLAVLLQNGIYDDNAHALCIDINPRALRFTEFNALLNNLEDKITTSIQDLQQPSVINNLLDEYKSKFNLIVANPPFIPVPSPSNKSYNDDIQRRYGLFSSAGSTGEEILQIITELSPYLLNKSNGIVAIVSEFMNPGDIPTKLHHWWNNTQSAFGILFSNEYPLSSLIYAQRRSSNQEENLIWNKHLDDFGISHISPGLLFILCNSTKHDMITTGGLKVLHKIVPKSNDGSIWTQQSRNAIQFTNNVWKNELGI